MFPLRPIFLGPVILLFALCLFCIVLVVVVMSDAVGVIIYGVDGSPSPEDQMRYTILLHVCWRYTMSWEYASAWSWVPWLRRANSTRGKTPQSLQFVCRGELPDVSEKL